MTNRYGFINDIGKDPRAYVFGSSQIVGTVLQPDGQWDSYLPSEEVQNLNNVEPYACASFGTLNCIETLLRRLDSQDVENFSDRYLAKMTGTQYQYGNSPHVVAEYIRAAGDVHQADWDFTPDVDSFEKFYADPPSGLVSIAKLFTNEFDFKHDYVPGNAASLKEALKFSPLGFSVTAWTQDGEGLYYNPGVPNNHWCMLFGYQDGHFWKVFDSYDNSTKHVRWDALPEIAKRYSISRKSQLPQQTIRDLILDKWRLIALLWRVIMKPV